jgi:hypothetical protein
MYSSFTFYIRFISFLCWMCFHFSFSFSCFFFSLEAFFSVILPFFNSQANSVVDFKIYLYRPLPCSSNSSVTIILPPDVADEKTSLISKHFYPVVIL